MTMTMSEHLEADAFKAVMRKLAATVTVVTVQGEGGRNGLTATAVCSVSAEPPQLLCCINRGASSLEDIRRAGVFAVNILKPAHRELAERFAREPSGETRFAVGNWATGPAGAPVLADATAWFECRLVDLIEAGSHAIAIGLVTDGGRDDGSQLIYAEGAYHVLQRAPGAERLRVGLVAQPIWWVSAKHEADHKGIGTPKAETHQRGPEAAMKGAGLQRFIQQYGRRAQRH